jgi:hypothetical protein
MSGVTVKPWLLLVYKIPREPTAGRVYVWRKLKQLGAIALQDAARVLPHTPRTLEQFQWLAAEITEMDGEAILWEAEQLYTTNADSLKRQFIDAVEAEYYQILADLKQQDRDLSALSKRFQSVQTRDHFASKLGHMVRKQLVKAGGTTP